MHALSSNLAGVLTPQYRYEIPLFQRDYVWSKDNWDEIWDDIVELYSNKKSNNHFMGSLVFIQVPSSMPVYEIIDGQQRLITLSLLLSALRDTAYNFGHDSLAAQIEENYLIHKHNKYKERYRVYPRWRDKDHYAGVIDGTPITGDKIEDVYSYFCQQIRALPNISDESVITDVFQTVANRLQFVRIDLIQSENPFQIFKSLNSTGQDLTESDLIRNFVFMSVLEQDREQFDAHFWTPLEKHFESNDPKKKGKLDGKVFSAFLRDFLMHNGDYVGVNTTFQSFERFCRDRDITGILQELHKYVDMYDIVRGIKKHLNSSISSALSLLNQTESSTAYPLVLNLLARVEAQEIPADKAAYLIQLLASFIVRRYVCNQTSRTYGKWFVAACASLKNDPVVNLTNFLVDKGFPDDNQFQQSLITFELGSGNYAKEILRVLERNSNHKEPADLDKATLEHIMPRQLNDVWRRLGISADIHGKYRHTIGNLTLTNYNSELAQKPFFDKLKMYKNSHFVITKKIADFSHTGATWSEKQIVARATFMADQAKKIWISPNPSGLLS